MCIRDSCNAVGSDADMQHLQRCQRIPESPCRGDVRRPNQWEFIYCRPVYLVAISYLASPGSASCRHHLSVVRQDVPTAGRSHRRVQVRQTTGHGAGQVRGLRPDLVTAAVLQPVLPVRHSYKNIFVVNKYVVLLIVRPKCTLASLHAAPWWITLSMRRAPYLISVRQKDGSDRRTDARPMHCAYRYRRSQCNDVRLNHRDCSIKHITETPVSV